MKNTPIQKVMFLNMHLNSIWSQLFFNCQYKLLSQMPTTAYNLFWIAVFSIFVVWTILTELVLGIRRFFFVNQKSILKKMGNLVFLMVLLGLGILTSLIAIHLAYLPTREGDIQVTQRRRNLSENDSKIATIFREKRTGLSHIRAQTIEQAVYAQGYTHAQDRLWQMEKQRRHASGTLAEVLGERALASDKFALTVGFRRIAQATWNNSDPVVSADTLSDDFKLTKPQRDLLEAYADGVNDYLSSPSLIWPPEFYYLGIESMQPWHPVDSLALMKLFSFHLSADWTDELLRDVFDNLPGELPLDLVDELVPFSAEHHGGNRPFDTILDDQDLRDLGLWDSTPILQQYKDHLAKGDEEQPQPGIQPDTEPGSSQTVSQEEENALKQKQQYKEEQERLELLREQEQARIQEELAEIERKRLQKQQEQEEQRRADEEERQRVAEEERAKSLEEERLQLVREEEDARNRQEAERKAREEEQAMIDELQRQEDEERLQAEQEEQNRILKEVEQKRLEEQATAEAEMERLQAEEEERLKREEKERLEREEAERKELELQQQALEKLRLEQEQARLAEEELQKAEEAEEQRRQKEELEAAEQEALRLAAEEEQRLADELRQQQIEEEQLKAQQELEKIEEQERYYFERQQLEKDAAERQMEQESPREEEREKQSIAEEYQRTLELAEASRLAVAVEEEAQRKAELEALKAIAKDINDNTRIQFGNPEKDSEQILKQDSQIQKPKPGTVTKVDNIRVIEGLPGKEAKRENQPTNFEFDEDPYQFEDKVLQEMYQNTVKFMMRAELHDAKTADPSLQSLSDEEIDAIKRKAFNQLTRIHNAG